MRKILGNVTLVFVTIAVMTVFCEIAFRMFMPISVTNVGYVDRPNGEKYGWGFAPNELVRIEKPDSADVIYDRVNSEGWRDEERDVAKPDGTFRILVMGDSMTFGYIVAKDEVFTTLLQKKLRGVRRHGRQSWAVGGGPRNLLRVGGRPLSVGSRMATDRR